MLSQFVWLLAPIVAASGEAKAPALHVEGEGCLAGLEVAVALREPATARATLQGGALILEMRVRDELGRREIAVGEAPCDEVRAVATLAVALSLEVLGAVDLTGLPAAPSPPAGSPHVTPPLAATPPLRAPAREPSRIRALSTELPDASTIVLTGPRPAQLGVAVDVGLAVGLTSNAALSTSVLADLGWSPARHLGPELSGRLGLFAAWPSRMTLDTDQGDQSVLSLWAGRADGCAGLAADALRARLCATAIAGTLDGTALQAAGYLAAGGRAEIAWRATPRVALTLSGDTVAKLAPTTLTVETAQGDTTTAPEKNPLAVLFATGVTTDFL